MQFGHSGINRELIDILQSVLVNLQEIILICNQHHQTSSRCIRNIMNGKGINTNP
jgi:hypothetical protein